MGLNNDERDRTVPPDENYYGDNYTNRSINDIIDNQYSSPEKEQLGQGFNPTEQFFEFNNAESHRHSSEPPRKKKKKKRKKPKILQIIIAIILVLAISIPALAAPILNKITYDDKEKNSYISSSELESSSSVTNILLLGVDARANEEGSTSRSDSMMLVSLDSKHNCIKLVSFLRDTWVYIPCADKNQRLNAACSIGGYQAVADTIEYNFGIKIDGYVVTDFEMFKVMVDSIGGVEVDVTEKEANEVTSHQKRYDHVNLDPGLQTLTGEQALAYCRIRKIDTDWKRTERQRTVIQEILKGILHSGPFTAYKTAKGVAPYIETNLSKAEIVKAATRALGCISGGFNQTHLPFEDTWKYAKKGGASVISIDVDENKDKLIDYIYNSDGKEEK